jgi:WD40 repeat protein
VSDLISKISIEGVATIVGDKPFSDARFSEDGLTIVTKCETGYERWNAKTGERLNPPEAHDPDVNTFATKSWKEIGCDALDESTTKAVGSHFNGLADLVTISPNGRYVAFGSISGYLGVFDVELDMPLILHGHTTSMNNHMHQNSINAILFDSSSTYLVSVAEEDCNPLLWDLTAASKEKTWNQRPGRLFDHPLELKDVMPSLFGTIAFSPIAPKLVTTHCSNQTTRVWEIIRTP